MNRNKTLLQRKTRVDISGQEIHTQKKSQLHELNLKLHTTKQRYVKQSHQLVHEKFTSYTLVGCSHPVHKIANKEKSLNSEETDDKSNFK